MTLVTIDLGDVAGGHDPDDHVVIRAEAFRESHSGGVTSTAEVIIPLVDGVGQAEVEPGPVVVAFRCRAVADTREKRGVVPDQGPVGIEDVIAGAFEYTPPVVNRGLDLIEGARDEALGQVSGAVDTAIGTRLDTKADVSTVNDLAAVTTGFTGVARRNARRIRELVSGLATKADTATVDAALATKADKTTVDAALATKADTATVDGLSALVVSALGVGRRNATRVRRLVADLATKADKADVDDLSALTTNAVGMGKRNATRIRQLVAALAGKADQSALIAGLAQKADTSTLDARIPAGGHSGQLLMATPTGGRWSWADRHPTQYHDIY